jgi:hypothetical protein
MSASTPTKLPSGTISKVRTIFVRRKTGSVILRPIRLECLSRTPRQRQSNLMKK